MAPLHDALRRELEKTVIKAREVAEAGARAALARLTVADREPGAHLGADDRVLRNRLRARARQLGDRRNERTGEQTTERLAQEVAYEAWHRMLFARVLAENRLLIHPEMQVPVSLEECEELAAEEGIGDGWVLASRYAARMLPEIFRPDDPVLQVPFAPEHQQELERLVGERTVPRETFLADDALGWVYQFWQARRKDEVNASGEKITGETLPAVTQLFTEPYMVSFLLENSIGAWWTGRNPGQEPPVAMPYLRRLADGTPAAGTFDGWPKTWRGFTLLDPCCGSGHFLVAALKLIVPLRMRDEALSAREAVDAVLRENLHGLELDARCTQIAAFALALAAWTTPGAAGYRPLPELQIACSGLAVAAKRQEWVALAEGDQRLEAALGRLHDLFRLAPELGSLIDPTEGEADLLTAGFSDVQPLLERALASERARRDEEREAVAVAAQGVATAADLLSRDYVLVCTNVPFLTSGKHSDELKAVCRERYFDGRYDLATCFIERILGLLRGRGTTALVSPHNWLFLGSYRALRRKRLQSSSLQLVARLGARAFETIDGEVVGVALTIVSNDWQQGLMVRGIDASVESNASTKRSALRTRELQSIPQETLLQRDDARIVFADSSGHAQLLRFVHCHQGLATGDLPRFGAFFWEHMSTGDDWLPWQSSVSETVPYGGRSMTVLWEHGRGSLHAFNEAHKAVRKNTHLRGTAVLGRRGVVITQVGDLPATLYTGEHFDDNTTVMVPSDPTMLPALWAYLSSPVYLHDVRGLDASLKVPAHTLAQVPFDLEYWQRVAEELYPNGLPEPHSDDPTQWLFEGGIPTSIAPLQVAVGRLVGYRWPDQPTNPHLDALVDNDGIVCLPSVRGEQPAADRLQALLAAAYGAEWSPAKRDALLADVGFAGKSLEQWIRDGFFDQHCKLFHQRPFIWHIWDGRKDGFSALVNYHRLTHRTLESLTYTYLGDWIGRQDEAADRGEAGAEGRAVAARDLQDSLKLILAGEPPHDIFVRWKPLHEQPIGWDPDLNDGVRVNIWPFVEAGILRKAPNIKWGKDRGKNPPDNPWGEERWNRYEDIPRDQRPAYLRDVKHLTTEIKRRAREALARGLPLSRLHEVGA